MSNKSIFGFFVLTLLLVSTLYSVSADNSTTQNISQLRDEQKDNRDQLNQVQQDRMDYMQEQRDKFRNASTAGAKREIINETRGELRDYRNESMMIRKDIRGNRTDLREMILSERMIKLGNKQASFLELNDSQKELIVGRINARTGLNLTIEDIGNTSMLKVILANGESKEVKYLPDVAAKAAEDRLKANCEVRNCTVELKEVGTGNGNSTRLAYEVTTEKDSRLFFFFRKKMPVIAEVDTDSGNITSVHRPWWAFMAKEADDSASPSVDANTSVSSG